MSQVIKSHDTDPALSDWIIALLDAIYEGQINQDTVDDWLTENLPQTTGPRCEDNPYGV